ncbi:DUF1742-domain-containing protein [Tothia fuscella]|uniref:DUF1742-domain-containing protein n=1 Tax=Tothia fuscella TaxID=1048955 RepID=A0A9P4TZA9_9PEZI|nr:DUF1742-domain-containing protein [Tothia fuscella]
MASNAALPNIWHHRKVADNAAKACWICFKPSSSVLITPDNKDFFYICTGHLKDRGFAIPDADEAAAAAAREKKVELDKEIEAVKKEYDEKMRKRAENRKEKKKKEGKGSKDEEKKEEKKDEDEEKKDEEEKDAKIEALSSKEDVMSDDGPRIFSLQKIFYQQRLDRIRNAEVAKRNRERLKNPTAFPSAPKGDP